MTHRQDGRELLAEIDAVIAEARSEVESLLTEIETLARARADLARVLSQADAAAPTTVVEVEAAPEPEVATSLAPADLATGWRH